MDCKLCLFCFTHKHLPHLILFHLRGVVAIVVLGPRFHTGTDYVSLRKEVFF